MSLSSSPPFIGIWRAIVGFFQPDVPNRSLSEAELRAIGRSLMADPETRRAIIHEVLGTLPITGGTCSTPASEVSSGNFGADCSDTGAYTFTGSVGIGTSSPTSQLQVTTPSTSTGILNLTRTAAR